MTSVPNAHHPDVLGRHCIIPGMAERDRMYGRPTRPDWFPVIEVRCKSCATTSDTARLLAFMARWAQSHRTEFVAPGNFPDGYPLGRCDVTGIPLYSPEPGEWTLHMVHAVTMHQPADKPTRRTNCYLSAPINDIHCRKCGQLRHLDVTQLAARLSDRRHAGHLLA